MSASRRTVESGWSDHSDGHHGRARSATFCDITPPLPLLGATTQFDIEDGAHLLEILDLLGT